MCISSAEEVEVDSDPQKAEQRQRGQRSSKPKKSSNDHSNKCKFSKARNLKPLAVEYPDLRDVPPTM